MKFNYPSFLSALPFLIASAAYAAPSTAHVKVDVRQSVTVVPSIGLGLGVAVWDGHMTDPEVAGLIRDAGFSVIRYPGGSYADIYHWKTNAPTKGLQATVQPNDDFDHFMALTQAAKTQALITVNYGSNIDGTAGGDPAEAAAWVKYANVDHSWGVRYWEIGNEVYGNGEYGAKWEEDLHSDKSPSEYGRNVNAYVTAMKAVDPSIKVGAVLTAPDAWPDGNPPAWNPTVLGECGKNIDFVVIHWYPDQGHRTGILDAVEANIPNIGHKARALVDQYCRPHTPIWISEGDASGYDMQAQGALFAADLYPRLWESGIENFDWWDLHNGIHVGKNGVGDDQGILSNASCDDGTCEPAVNTPFPPYYGVELVHRLASPGDMLVSAQSDSPSIVAYGVRKRDGSDGVMLINKDGDEAADVSVEVDGASISTPARTFVYSKGDKAIETGTTLTAGHSMTVRLSPYSVEVLLFRSIKTKN